MFFSDRSRLGSNGENTDKVLEITCIADGSQTGRQSRRALLSIETPDVDKVIDSGREYRVEDIRRLHRVISLGLRSA